MKAPLIITSLGALITCAPLSAYSLTRESIKDKVYDHCIQETASLDGWKIAEKKFKETEFSTENLISPFKELHNNIKTKDNLTGSDLRDTCINLYSWDNSSIFKKENSDLLSQIKKYCFLKIEDRLGSENKIEDEKIETKTQELSTHTQEKGILTEKLKSVEGSQKEKFKEACKELYEKPFLSEESNDWLLVKNYCKKTT